MAKRLVEDCLTLDLAWLMRLAPIRGHAGTGEIEWTVDGNSIGALRFLLDLRGTETARLILRYTVVAKGGGQKARKQVIALRTLPQHFGGRRWWMRCPVTGQLVRTVHLPSGGECFAGRKAWDLAYRVERLNRFDRSFEKLFRAQRRLGNSEGLGMGLERPKGMWHRTFASHANCVAALDLNCTEKIAALIRPA